MPSRYLPRTRRPWSGGTGCRTSTPAGRRPRHPDPAQGSRWAPGVPCSARTRAAGPRTPGQPLRRTQRACWSCPHAWRQPCRWRVSRLVLDIGVAATPAVESLTIERVVRATLDQAVRGALARFPPEDDTRGVRNGERVIVVDHVRGTTRLDDPLVVLELVVRVTEAVRVEIGVPQVVCHLYGVSVVTEQRSGHKVNDLTLNIGTQVLVPCVFRETGHVVRVDLLVQQRVVRESLQGFHQRLEVLDL